MTVAALKPIRNVRTTVGRVARVRRGAVRRGNPLPYDCAAVVGIHKEAAHQQVTAARGHRRNPGVERAAAHAITAQWKPLRAIKTSI